MTEQSMIEEIDALILGSGQGGNPLASAFASAGRRTVMVESKLVGGTCVNYGCTPTKTMIGSALVAAKARDAERFGIRVPGPVTADMARVRDRKREVVARSHEGSEKRFEGKENLELVRGLGRFTGGRTVEVALNEGGARTFQAKQVFINTGARTSVPGGLGLEQVPYLTNETVMELDKVPEHLLILGGSYIAVEFAQMFRRLGARVTIVGNAPQLLPREDPDLAACLQGIFEQDGIDMLLGAEVVGAEAPATLKLKDGRAVSGSHLLLAAGREPNSDQLQLEKTGLQADEHGFIPVNERLETSAAGIYALGDVKGGPAFTHVSYDDYRILSSNLLEGGRRTVKDRPTTYTVFTNPELGRIGLSEEEARKAGRQVRIATMPAVSIARAFEVGDDRGMLKVIVDGASDQILGAAMLASEGGELAAMIQIAMMGALPYTALRDACFAHPTWAESLNSVFFRWREG